jgi:predicted metal-dependent phosphoesterase TrpH
MKIDFHVHTSEYSPCARSTADEQIRAAITHGLDAVVITDHFHILTPSDALRLNRKYAPFRILPGAEITSDGEDWLVYGVSDPLLEDRFWEYPELHQFVHSHGGTIVLAHPFRFHPGIHVDLRRFPPDAIELYSNNIIPEHYPAIRELANSLGLPTLCNSDSHHETKIGLYFNILDGEVDGDASIFASLRAGRLRPSVSEPAVQST